MWWTPGGSEQPRAAATLPAGVPPPGPGPGHAASRGCCSREAKLRIALYTQARVLGVPGAGRIKDNTDEEVISFISCQEQGNDSLVTAESPFLSIEGRQHTHEVFKGRKLKENVDLCKEKPRNADGEISGTGSRWAPPRDLSAPPASIHTHVTGLSALPSRRHRRSWNWFNETGGRRLPPRLRTRLLGTPTWAWLWAAALVVWWCTAAATAGDCRFPANQTCPSMYLRNLTHLEDLCACAKVSGCLHLSLIYVKDENEERYLQSLSFPHLLEITDYLFIYDVPRLSTLGKLFPNLSVIRGERVFYNYALVIRKMRDLQEVGLFSLTAVLRGSVRVEGNPRLCFAHTVDWDAITSCRLDRNVIKKNKPQCDEPCSERCRGAKKCDRLRCWNQDRCQILCSDGCQGRCVAGQASGTPTTAISTPTAPTTCDATPLHEVCPFYSSPSLAPSLQCVWNVMSEAGHPGGASGGTSLLPDKLCRRGLTVAATHPRRQWCGCQRGGSAHLCESPVVHSVGEAECLAHCCSLGNLTINHTGGERIDAELQKAFRNIVEIRGYLKIQNSNITSTKILPNLRSIGCRHKDNQNFSLVVLDNPLLQDLDPWTDSLTVEGDVFFQKNPRLCMRHIRRLTQKLNLSEAFVSPTNGQEMLCQQETLKVTVRSWQLYGQLAVFLNPSRTDLEPNATYFVSYREAPVNINVTFTRDSCHDDRLWTVVEVTLPEVLQEEPLVLLKGLSPATRYALYVSTISTRSAIVTATTSLFNLSQPTEVSWKSLGNSSLQVWWHPPPLPPDVAIHHYLVTVLLRPTPPPHSFWDPDRAPTSFSRSSEGRMWNTTRSGGDTKEACSAPPEPRFSCCSCRPPAQKTAPPTPTTHKPFEEELFHSISFINVVQEEAALPLLHHDSLLLGDDISVEDLQVYSSILGQWQPWGVGDPQLVPVEVNCVSNKNTIDSCQHGEGVRADEKVPGRYLQASLPAPSEDSRLVQHYETNITTLTLHRLRHFSLYTVAVTACLQPRRCIRTTPVLRSTNSAAASTPASWEPVFCKLCSTVPALLSAFTDPSPLADIVPENSMQALVSNASSSVTVSWLSPASFNGRVVYYVLQCKAWQGESLERLVSPAEHHKPGQRQSVVLSTLEPGNYTCTVAATSLLGRTDSNATVSFLLMSSHAPAYSSRGEWWASLGGAAALAVVGAALLWWWRRWKSTMFVDGINWNYKDGLDLSKFCREEFIIGCDKLTILDEQPLGYGHFGIVRRGDLRTEGGVRRVAVKTHSRDDDSNKEISRFLKEAEILQDIRCHHVVQLVGVVSDSDSLYVVMELMEERDLKDYLIRNRDRVTEKSLLEMAVQAADGMAYLAWRGVVHRDLAARNCLLDRSLTLKIGDFGLAKTLKSSYYKIQDCNDNLPVRMAPESRQNGRFSSRSDVWSYGVLLLEMVMRGDSPDYVRKPWLVTRSPPEISRYPSGFVAVMRCARIHEPHERPTFRAIASFLLEHVSPEFERKVKEVSFVHSRSAEAASDEDNRHLQRLRANDLSYKDLPQGPAKLHQVTSFHSSGLPSPVPSTSISSSSPQHPAHAPFMLMVTSPHVPHGHALATAAKDTRFSCHQVQSSSVQSKGHVHTNCMSCEPLRMLPQDAQESGSRSCLQERGTPPCPHHSRENEVEMFNSLAKSFQSSTSQSSLESDSSPPTVSNFVPSLSSSPHSSLFYSSSTSDTSRSVYSSSSGFQLSASRSFMSGSTAVESSSTLPTPPSSLLVPLNTFHYTQSNIPLPHACSNELLSASPPPLRRAAAVFATPARAFPGLSDASVQAQSVRLIAESHPVPHRPPAIFSCSFLDTRTSKKLSLNSLTLSRLSPKLAAASEPLLSSHNAPQRSPTITPLSSQQSFFITSASISEHQDSSEEKYSTLASSCRALDPFFPTSVVSSGSVPSSAPPSLPLTRKTQVFSATSDLGSGRRHRRRRHTSLPEGGEEQ